MPRLIHPLKAIRAAWSAFWAKASEGIRADRGGMQAETYREDMERYAAFIELKKGNPKAVEALEKRSGRIVYELIMLDPTQVDFVNRLVHLHGQASILVKDVLTEIINAEAYLKIVEKEVEKIEEQRKQRT